MGGNAGQSLAVASRTMMTALTCQLLNLSFQAVEQSDQCSRKRVRQLKKNVKSHVFWILKKKPRKKRKKRTGRPTQPVASEAT